jgi:nucleotide-binding universal stress UspA family protein
MRTILVPLDGSDFAEHALPLAFGIARRAEAGLELVSVHESPASFIYGIGGTPGQDLALDQQRDAGMRAQRRKYLDGLGEQLHASDGDVPVAVALLEGSPAATLAEYVRDTVPDLVVMTTHGRGGASRLWLGSVTEGLVRRTTVPVLALLGGYTLISAGAALDVARNLTRRGEPAWPFLVYGLAATVVAALLVWWPTPIGSGVLAVLALWLALGGTAELMLASQLRGLLPHGRLLAAVGMLSVLAALVLLLAPRWAAAPEARVIGLYALLSGLFLSGLAVRLRREQHALDARLG